MGLFNRKPDAIDHNAATGIGTAFWEAGKGALLGAAAITLIGATLGALFIPGVSALAGAVIGALGGAGLSYVYAGPLVGLPTLFGFFSGLARGGSRVGREKAEFRRQMEGGEQGRQFAMASRFNDEKIASMQASYMLGTQDAEARMAAQLQAQAAQPQPAAPAATATANAAAKCECGPHTKAELQRREASAAAAATGVTQPTV